MICHIVPSVDGRIVPGGWPALRELTAQYERTGASLEADAVLPKRCVATV